MEQFGVWCFRMLMRVCLPAWFRDEAAHDMEHVFRERHRESGPIGWPVAWLRESAGVVRAGVGARFTTTEKGGWGAMLGQLLQDLKYALRNFRRRPLHAALATGTLGLGIAASTAMFSVVDGVLLKPLPWGSPDRIVSVYPTNPGLAGHPTLGAAAIRGTFSNPEVDLVARSKDGILTDIAILAEASATYYPVDGPALRVSAVRTNASLFPEVLRTSLARGRSFTLQEEESGASVILITDAFWRGVLAEDPDVLGRRLTIGSSEFEVIGVLRPDFALEQAPADIWLPMGEDEEWGRHSFWAIARLADGITIEEAEPVLSSRFQAEAHPGHQEHSLKLFPLQAEEVRAVRGPLMLLSVASIVLLLVACGNVAVLLIGASLDRQEELAVRGALGAGRSRLFRQLVTESMTLSMVGAVLGLALTRVAITGLAALAPAGMPRVGSVAIDARVLMVGIGVSLLCGLLFGVGPAWLFSRGSLARSMGTRGARGGKGRLQGAVVVAELALATVLVVGAGLMSRTVMKMSQVDAGFEVENVLYARFTAPTSRVAPGLSGDERDLAMQGFLEGIRSEVAQLPGVTSAAYTSVLPLSGSRGNNNINAAGADGDGIVASRRFVNASFFKTLGVRLVAGRDFSDLDDRPGAPQVLILSEGAAAELFPDGDAIGRQVEYWGRSAEVVGIVPAISDVQLTAPTPLAYYVPMGGVGEWSGTLLIRTDPSRPVTPGEIRERIQDSSQVLALQSVAPLSDLIRSQLADERYRARLVTAFSILAALFALLGIYGVMARSVAARGREMGIRRALGATGSAVAGMVLGQAFRLSFYGALTGIGVALLLGRMIEGFLWGVEPTDPLTLIGTAVLLGGASLAAAMIPGRRAAAADPIVALRAE